MFHIKAFHVEPFIADFTPKAILSCVFRYVIFKRLCTAEPFTTVFTGEASALVCSHVDIIITLGDKTLSTFATEIRVLSRVVLVMSLQSRH